MKNPERKRKKRERLYQDQDGKCTFCECDMVLDSNGTPKRKNFPANSACVFHLDSKLNPDRGKSEMGVRRIVLACRACCDAISREENNSLSLAERRRRAGHSETSDLRPDIPPMQLRIDLIDRANALLSDCGFVFRDVSQSHESFYHSWPGFETTLRVSFHNRKRKLQRPHPQSHMCVASVSFEGNRRNPAMCQIKDAQFENRMVGVIGRYFIKSREHAEG